jgi:hypothetical protein
MLFSFISTIGIYLATMLLLRSYFDVAYIFTFDVMSKILIITFFSWFPFYIINILDYQRRLTNIFTQLLHNNKYTTTVTHERNRQISRSTFLRCQSLHPQSTTSTANSSTSTKGKETKNSHWATSQASKSQARKSNRRGKSERGKGKEKINRCEIL